MDFNERGVSSDFEWHWNIMDLLLIDISTIHSEFSASNIFVPVAPYSLTY